MTRKHFEALAEALKHENPNRLGVPGIHRAETSQWEVDVIAVADACAQFNGNFDRGRFYRAAGLEG